MLRAAEGVGVLLLLSVFFAYVLAPVGAAVQRRVRFGPRRRPIPLEAALLLVYVLLFAAGAIVWRFERARVAEWVHVTAPATVEHLFRGSADPWAPLAARLPLPPATRSWIVARGGQAIRYIERETRATLADLIAASSYAKWLAVAPLLAFVLLTAAPGFQRSALRALPHGHLQWRGEEYFRDVNSALAGYVRAQTAAAVIVGTISVAAFLLIGLPSAIAIGVMAGVLELVPAIGPLTTFLVASAQAGDRLLAVVLFLLVLRIAQDYLIYPRLIRKGMHLSTPAVILTIWAGAVLADAAGVILAIPVAGFLSVSLRHWREFRDIERLVRSAGAR